MNIDNFVNISKFLAVSC